MTDFRARGTIMGPTGLTAVFGMGTGVTPPVWSPEMPPEGGQAAPGVRSIGWSVTVVESTASAVEAIRSSRVDPHGRGSSPEASAGSIRVTGDRSRRLRGRGRRIGVVKRSAVGTGPLRRSPAVHSRPIDLVVFQEPS